MIKSISILGSTGFIGTKAVEIAKNLNIKVEALAAFSNIALLEDQIRRLKPKLVAVYNALRAKELKIKVADLNVKVVYGMAGLCEAAAQTNADMVLNSVVGMVGLKPTIEAIRAKKDIALANKETLVAGGELVMSEARKAHVNILPVDSEHSAIFQCMQGINQKDDIKRIILTASGGPFFGRKISELKDISKVQALKHPSWSMGPKITIDSATMMNKGLEIIEASWLFNLPLEKINVLIHRESIVHSMIEYVDNSVIAQMGVADMAIPIQYAITYPARFESLAQQLNLARIGKLTFFEPDYDTFVCLKLSREALNQGGLTPATLNGANEEAVSLFLEDKITFLEIGELVTKAIENKSGGDPLCIEDILDADREARRFVRKSVDLTY